jgi:hypothetical protein
MTARSTGVFPREGINLDNAFEVPYNGSIQAPVTLAHCRTLRVTAVGFNVTGDAVVAIDIGANVGDQVLGLDSTTDFTKPVVFHVRGFHRNQECLVTPLVNTGTITPGKVFVELLDGPAH